MKIQLLKAMSFLLLACNAPSNQSESNVEDKRSSHPQLQEQWASDTILRTPESVLFDSENNIIYVANVNLNPWEKDGNGFISQLDLRGKVINLKWVEGLDGPKGMGIVDRHLFVADIDQVIEIDIATAKIINRYPVADTPTLNDITVLDKTIFISGSDSQKLFKLQDGTITKILEGDLGRPNGLYAEVDRLLMLTSTSSVLESINYETMARTKLVEGLGHGDGIVPVGDGSYLASSWRGTLFHISSDWVKTELLDTQEKEINAADIDYIQRKNLLLVPTFFDNRIVAYSLNQN